MHASRGTVAPRTSHTAPLNAALAPQSGHAAQRDASPIIPCRELPGPLSVASLARLGALVPLDATGCYLTIHAGSVHGRAAIVERVIPPDATACASLALWIWTGGTFPGVITVISHAHFRAAVYGRRMRAYDRRLAADERSRLGGVWVTSPLRTACDLACNDDVPTADGRSVTDGIVELMEDFDFAPDDCIALLQRNPRWPGRRRGMEMFQTLSGSYVPPIPDTDESASFNGFAPDATAVPHAVAVPHAAAIASRGTDAEPYAATPHTAAMPHSVIASRGTAAASRGATPCGTAAPSAAASHGTTTPHTAITTEQEHP